MNVAAPNVRHDVGDGKGRWYCYLLKCADGTFYAGITNSIGGSRCIIAVAPHDIPGADFRLN